MKCRIWKMKSNDMRSVKQNIEGKISYKKCEKQNIYELKIVMRDVKRSL